jgi:hypothetical protein
MLRRALALVLCVALAAAPVAADETPASVEVQARAHYEAAQKLYDEGKYDEAIAEYQDAYRLKPHPNTIYNIAQAYERLLDYAQSVAWFERYLKEAPPDAPFRTIVSNRLRLLRDLPARVSITSIPEHVHAAIVNDKGERVELDTPALFKVPAGRYTIDLSQPGWELESHEITTEIGQPYFYQYRLKRSMAQVSIFTRPRGARVFLDDTLRGETPFAGTVEVGRHRLLLEHRDYPWHREELDVRAGQPLKREIRLIRPVRSGRTELVLASMVYGGVAGPLLVSAIVTDPKFGTSGYGLLAYILSSAAGISAGFLTAFLATRDGVKVGTSSLMIGGGAWGTSWLTSLGLGLDIPSQYVYGMAIGGGLLGAASALLIARRWDISAGDAGLVNSGGLWGTGFGALLAQAIWRRPTGAEFGWLMLGGTSLGLATGSILAKKLELSRGHVALIDVGGLAGTGLGFALGAAIGANSKTEDTVQAGARYALGGMALGLIAGSVFTRKYRGDLPPVEALILRKRGQWAFAIPSLTIDRAVTPEGTAPRFTVTLAKGSF